MLKLCNSINDRISISDVKKQFANGINRSCPRFIPRFRRLHLGTSRKEG